MRDNKVYTQTFSAQTKGVVLLKYKNWADQKKREQRFNVEQREQNKLATISY